MNKIAELNILKEMLANEYLQKAAQLDALINQAVEMQKQAALEEMVKEAVSMDLIRRSANNAALTRKGIDLYSPSSAKFLPMDTQIKNMLLNKAKSSGYDPMLFSSEAEIGGKAKSIYEAAWENLIKSREAKFLNARENFKNWLGQ